MKQSCFHRIFSSKSLPRGPSILPVLLCFNISFSVPCTDEWVLNVVTGVLITNQLDALISQIYFWNETPHVSDRSSNPSSGVFHCARSNGICHTGLQTACEQEHLLLLTSCLQTCMTYTIAACTVKNS